MRFDPDRVKTRTPGRQFMNFSRFSAFSAITGSAERKKFAPDAPFSDNFRVFAQSGPKAAVTTGEASRLRRQHPQTGHPLRLYGIEEHIKRRDPSIAVAHHIH